MSTAAMPAARERILARLRRAPAAALPAPVAVNAITAADLNGRPVGNLVESFRNCLETMHAEVREIGVGEIEAVVAEICAAKKIRTLMLPPTGADFGEWRDGPQLRRFDRVIEAHKDALFGEIDAGLTIADCGLADTGMLVIASSPAQPRTLSLVPPIHICLIDRHRLHLSMPAALAAEGWAAAMPSNLIFISGPSKTADIQQTLAYGAHGPKELVVLVVDRGARP